MLPLDHPLLECLLPVLAALLPVCREYLAFVDWHRFCRLGPAWDASVIRICDSVTATNDALDNN